MNREPETVRLSEDDRLILRTISEGVTILKWCGIFTLLGAVLAATLVMMRI